ncbi:DUF2892 domain-containing protein [bacterium]|nr:DUF2892 domain-containing protein [bacterium]MBU1636984.1 DUF2892 domain-containing protein [bacterium]MBU1920875.1 DUF2892 domain-containing protein [bacterium]RQV96033.1 MAG: DUF2892 domain-containing protein [bacterium]
MKANVGGADRAIRIILGLVILALGYFYHSWWGLVGLIPLLTGLFRFCGAYPMLGINTCKTKTEVKQ